MHNSSRDGSGQPLSRRTLLGGVGAAALAGLAGCTGSTPPLEPEVPQAALDSDGWTQVANVDESFTEEVTVSGITQTVHADTKTDVYRNDRPVTTAADSLGVEPSALGGTSNSDTGDDSATADDDGFRLPPAQFVASKARTDPPVSRLLGLSETLLTRFLDRAEDQAKSQLRESGFENVQRVDSGTLSIDAAGEARHRRYTADYPYPETTVEYQGRDVTVESGTFTVEAQLSVWPYDGLLAAAGGAYPGEEGSLTLSAAGTTRERSLGLQPRGYRESVRRLTSLVS